MNPTQALQDAWLDGLNSHDVGAVADCYTDDAVFTDVGTGQVTHGRVELRGALEAFFAAFGELHVERSTQVTDGSVFAHEFTMSGVHSGSAPGLPATGKSFSLPGAVVGEIRAGKLSRVTHYWNMADLLTQVGALPSSLSCAVRPPYAQ